MRHERNRVGLTTSWSVATVPVLIALLGVSAARPVRFSRAVAATGATAALPAGRTAAGPDAQYRIQTLAGNGKAGDIPNGGGKATEVPVDLPFGVEIGPGGDLYITAVGSHRVLRLDRRSGQVTSVAGTGRKGYSGD